MSLGQAISTCFRKYATFSGRARRSEFWWFFLFVYVVGLILVWVDGLLGLQVGASTQEVMINDTAVPLVSSGFGVLSSIFGLATLIPGIAVFVRRVHDSNKSGWLALLSYVLILACGIGLILQLILGLLKSTPGDNKYGPETA
ncbi:MAG: DUF805 domain-containing protein [Actinomycetota bacterium]|nr:DUF805 domain-containing protein [Actinomycetota bacterium]